MHGGLGGLIGLGLGGRIGLLKTITFIGVRAHWFLLKPSHRLILFGEESGESESESLTKILNFWPLSICWS